MQSQKINRNIYMEAFANICDTTSLVKKKVALKPKTSWTTIARKGNATKLAVRGAIVQSYLELSLVRLEWMAKWATKQFPSSQ